MGAVRMVFGLAVIRALRAQLLGNNSHGMPV